jgi:hypothetical protein
MTLADIRARALAQLMPPERLPLSQWIEREIVLPDDVSALPGRVRLWPYQREIADAISDPLIERITLVKSARLGFSCLVTAAIGHFVVDDPSPISGSTGTSGGNKLAGDGDAFVPGRGIAPLEALISQFAAVISGLDLGDDLDLRSLGFGSSPGDWRPSGRPGRPTRRSTGTNSRRPVRRLSLSTLRAGWRL